MWCILCILIPFLAAIIGAILGWLLRHLTCKCNDEDKIRLEECLSENKRLKLELETCLSNRKTIESDLDACLSSRKNLELDLANCKAKNEELISNKAKFEAGAQAASSILSFTNVDEVEPSLVFDGAIAKQFIGKKVIADNLTVVEGIGPKIAELFNQGGINTWYQLSKTSVERCQEILDGGGPRFAIHKPTTWPKQAELAFEGKWEELNLWQDELDGGR